MAASEIRPAGADDRNCRWPGRRGYTGVIVARRGPVKTVIACAVMAHDDVPTLVLVDRTRLIEQ